MSEKAENNNIMDNQDIVLDVSENQTDNPNNDTNVTRGDNTPSNNTSNKNKSKKFWGKVDNFFKISERGKTAYLSPILPNASAQLNLSL